MDSRCAICGNGENNTLHTATELYYRTGETFTYLECSGCGCLQLVDVPADLSVYYPQKYYSFDLTPDTWKAPQPWKVFLRRHHAKFKMGRRDLVGQLTARRYPHWSVPEWLKYVSVDLDDPILDVGSGGGGTLLGLAEIGFRNLTGVDPFVKADMTYPNGVRILKRFMSEVEGQYSLIISSHTFEHMPDPEQSLAQLAAVLAPGCMMALTMPIAGGTTWKKYQMNWIGLDAPRHLFLHNEKTMRILADKVGLVLERVEYDASEWYFTASEGYVRGIPLLEKRVEDYLTTAQIDEFKRLTKELNEKRESDQATFYLRRPLEAVAPQSIGDAVVASGPKGPA